MTKEVLEKEAEEKFKINNKDKDREHYYDRMWFEKGYIAGAEPREKRIADLERKLEQAEKDLTDYQFNYPKIKDLEKENAKLKKHIKADCIDCVDYIKNQKLEKQIEKMKCCENCKGVCTSDDVAHFCKNNDYKLWEIKND